MSVVWEPQWIGTHEPEELPYTKAIGWAVFWFLFGADCLILKALTVILK